MNAPQRESHGESPASRLDALLPPEMAVRAEEIGVRKAALHGPRLFTLVCLAVWLSWSARATADWILAVVPPINAFVAAFFGRNLLPITIGNIVGRPIRARRGTRRPGPDVMW